MAIWSRDDYVLTGAILIAIAIYAAAAGVIFAAGVAVGLQLR